MKLCTFSEPELDSDRSIQRWLLESPVRQGGMGLENQTDLIPAAFISGLEQALPHFGGEDGICPALAHLIEEGAEERYAPLIESGHRTGKELVNSWNKLRQEAEESCQYLGEEEIEGALSVPAAAAGQGSTNGTI